MGPGVLVYAFSLPFDKTATVSMASPSADNPSTAFHATSASISRLRLRAWPCRPTLGALAKERRARPTRHAHPDEQKTQLTERQENS